MTLAKAMLPMRNDTVAVQMRGLDINIHFTRIHKHMKGFYFLEEAQK